MKTSEKKSDSTKRSEALVFPSAMIEKWIEDSRLPRILTVFLLPIIMVVLFVVAFILEYGFTQLPSMDILRTTMLFPLFTAYILLYSQILKKKRDKALASFRPVVLIKDNEYSSIVAKAALFSPRGQILALTIGLLAGLIISGFDWFSSISWISIYGFIVSIVLYILIGWWIYYTLAGTRLFTKLQGCSLDIDIFDLAPLKPIASWSLSLTLMYALGITLSIVMIPHFKLNFITIFTFGVYILAAALVFFLNLAGAHRIIIDAKQRELAVVQRGITSVSEALKEKAVISNINKTKEYLDTFQAWIVYEKRINEVPDWPYTVDIKRNLVISTLLPVIVMVLKGLLSKFVNQLSSIIP